MKLEVSIGEAIDKYSILQIKNGRITDKTKLENISNELNKLNECVKYIDKEQFLYNILMYINTEIWDMTNEIKKINVNDNNYSNTSKKIFDFNQKRFRVKNMFNLIFKSDITEQKSYFNTYCYLIIENEDIIFNKLAEINYLLFEYDCLLVDEKYINIFKRIFGNYNIYNTEDNNTEDNNTEDNNTENINLNNYTISESIKHIFTFKPIKYSSSGKLGDFIQVLSVINQTFYTCGKKGIIYIKNNHTFSNGLINTHSDTYNIIKTQNYILDYKIYNNEQIDIDLDLWFLNKSLLYNYNWIIIFSKTYNISWGYNKWINTQYDKRWENKVLINIMHYRKTINIDFNKLYDIFTDSLIFISFSKVEYEEFIRDTKLNIESYIPESFTDACIAINSCKMLVASLSAILTIGHACHKKRIIGLCGSLDDVHNIDFDKQYWNNVFYNVESAC